MNVPKLRFGEFSGDWCGYKIGDFVESYKGGAALTPSDFVPISECEVIPKKAITSGGKLITSLETPTYCSESFYQSNQQSVVDNSYLITTLRDLVPSGPSIGYIVKYTENKKFILAQGVYGLKIKNNISGDFLTWYSNTDKYRKIMQKIMVGSTQVHVRTPDFFDVELIAPALDEQQKIADFLSAVDEKITALAAQKTALTQYKQGMMQRIFSQTLRFKDDNGAEYPEWEVKYLKNVSAIYDGTHMTPDYQASGVPFYSVEHVTSDNFNDTKFISAEVFEKECKRVKIEKNDILMTRIGDIGTSKLIDWDVKASFYVSLALIKPFTTTVGSYLNQYIRSSYFQRELHQRTIHVAFPKKINLGEIGECVVKLPNFDEQTKIAQFLTELDNKINAVDAQIQSAQQWKQGLLQQMFV